MKVGFISKMALEAPIVRNKEFAGVYCGWVGKRAFPIDMAGFAFSLAHYRKISEDGPKLMPYKHGYEEDGFVVQLQVPIESAEIIAPNEVTNFCSSVQKYVVTNHFFKVDSEGENFLGNPTPLIFLRILGGDT